MSARYKIIKSASLKYVVIEGTTSYEELERLFFKYIRDPEFAPDLRILADLRGMTDALAGLWEIKKLKDLYRYAYHNAVGAVDVVIVTGEGIAYRSARLFQWMMRDKKPLVIQIADNMTKAQNILGLSDNAMRKLNRIAYSPRFVSIPIK